MSIKASNVQNGLCGCEHINAEKLVRGDGEKRCDIVSTVELCMESYSRATVIASLGYLIGLMSLVQYTSNRGSMDLLSDSATVGGDMARSASCYWTILWLAKQATNKLASG